ncbi:MAG: lysophospholipid acyltransferase family protein [Candidatus Rokubacteria bacterium]|nr:lysophospholipid acyltransferase family protein [Candidatus Rokubacteria bacterium]
MEPPVAAADPPGLKPRWYSHAYNRAELYRLAGAMGWLPRRVRLGLARQIGRRAPPLFPAERAIVARTLERMTGATGPPLAALVRRLFEDFAMCFSDLVSTNRRPAPELTGHVRAVSGIERVERVDGGLVSLTAHFGNWEMAGRLLAFTAARPTHVVVAPEEAQALERWVRRNGDGVRFVPRTRPTVSLELLAALRRGEVVAVQGDRALGSRGDALVPFFGEVAPFPLGPFLLARAAGVPLVPAFCVLEPDRRYSVTVMEPIRVKAGGEEEALREWVGHLEAAARVRPTQWFNFFDVWDPFRGHTRPP